MKTGIELIADERRRQVEQEGWTPEHDDQWTGGHLSHAASCYADAATFQVRDPEATTEDLVAQMLDNWPWDEEWAKPSDDPVRNLVKAGALIAAETDRLQRMGHWQNARGENHGLNSQPGDVWVEGKAGAK